MLEFVDLKCRFEALSDVVLTVYKGSTLRGLFKTVLRETCCLQPRQVTCQSCIVAGQCAYYLLAEHTTATGENTVLPYVIACARLVPERFETGAFLSFQLRLFGQAAAFLPVVVYSLTRWERWPLERFQPLISDREMRDQGPPNRWHRSQHPQGRLKLHSVLQQTPNGDKRLYDATDILEPPILEPLLAVDSHPQTDTTVQLEFTAPTRIFRKTNGGGKRRKQLIQPADVTFELLFRSLLTRLAGLNQYYGQGGEQWGHWVWESHRAAMAQVTLGRNALRHTPVRRYKRNNTRWVHLDGFTGVITFERVPGRLLPYLTAGTKTGIGKFPTMGFGEYRLSYRN